MADSNTLSVTAQELAKKIEGIKYIIAIKQILPCDTSSERLELYDLIRLKFGYKITDWNGGNGDINGLQSLADSFGLELNINKMWEEFYKNQSFPRGIVEHEINRLVLNEIIDKAEKSGKLYETEEKPVLVVDDEDIRYLISEKLENCGYKVLTAKSGDETITLLGNNGIGFGITDYDLSRGGGSFRNGLEAIKYCKENRLTNARFIVVTRKDLAQIKREVTEKGLDDTVEEVLEKSMSNLDPLVKAVQRVYPLGKSYIQQPIPM